MTAAAPKNRGREKNRFLNSQQEESEFSSFSRSFAQISHMHIYIILNTLIHWLHVFFLLPRIHSIQINHSSNANCSEHLLKKRQVYLNCLLGGNPLLDCTIFWLYITSNLSQLTTTIKQHHFKTADVNLAAKNQRQPLTETLTEKTQAKTTQTLNPPLLLAATKSLPLALLAATKWLPSIDSIIQASTYPKHSPSPPFSSPPPTLTPALSDLLHSSSHSFIRIRTLTQVPSVKKCSKRAFNYQFPRWGESRTRDIGNGEPSHPWGMKG